MISIIKTIRAHKMSPHLTPLLVGNVIDLICVGNQD